MAANLQASTCVSLLEDVDSLSYKQNLTTIDQQLHSNWAPVDHIGRRVIRPWAPTNLVIQSFHSVPMARTMLRLYILCLAACVANMANTLTQARCLPSLLPRTLMEPFPRSGSQRAVQQGNSASLPEQNHFSPQIACHVFASCCYPKVPCSNLQTVQSEDDGVSGRTTDPILARYLSLEGSGIRVIQLYSIDNGCIEQPSKALLVSLWRVTANERDEWS